MQLDQPHLDVPGATIFDAGYPRKGYPLSRVMSEEEYRDMTIKGGRSVEGNRVVGEDGDAQAHRQPQGTAGRT